MLRAFAGGRSCVAINDIEHIVIVLMENRSFDHMLGYLSLADAAPTMAVEGLHDDPAWQAQFTNDYTGKLYSLHPLDSIDQNIDDPPHDMQDIRTQISTATHGNASSEMGGFVQSYANTSPPAHDLSSVMGYYKKDAVPTSDFFARNFCICDHWFSSLPSGTQVNRLMAMAGESEIDNNVSSVSQFPDQTLVYDWLNSNGISWCSYKWGGFPFFTLMKAWRWKILLSLNDESGAANFRWYSNFAEQWKADGDIIPNVVFIEPEYSNNPVPIDPNDDHCPTGVAKGQQFLADIYNTLTSNPVRWSKTLMIVTYDEHGGFFDHLPPLAVSCVAGGYPFGTTGVRVPGFLVSPFVAPGRPCTMRFDHTAVLQLLAERFTPNVPYSEAVTARQQYFDRLSSIMTAQPQAAAPLLTATPTLKQLQAARPHYNPNDATAKAFQDVIQELQAKHPEWLKLPRWRALSQYLAANAEAAIQLQPGAIA
jgi:phospholipase C